MAVWQGMELFIRGNMFCNNTELFISQTLQDSHTFDSHWPMLEYANYVLLYTVCMTKLKLTL
jgi:hypothetical protein